MLQQAKNVFIVGIKGVGMANLAIILKKMAKNVLGCDIEEEYTTDQSLKEHKITVFKGFEASYLTQEIDLVIYSAAHGGINNPIIKQSQKKEINIVHQAEVLGELTTLFKNSIAICGCHGKTTTTSLLAYALKKLKAKPSYFVGSSSFNEFSAGEYDGKDYFVVEADEYGMNPPIDKTPKFHCLKPNYILCTNIDFDHPDVYKNIEETKREFLKFFENNLDSCFRRNDNGEKKLIFCADDKNLMEVAGNLKRDSYLTYGFSKNSDLRIVNYETTSQGTIFNFQFSHSASSGQAIYNQIKNSNFQFTIDLYGEKNLSNTVGVVLMLLTLGFKANEIKKAVVGFTGAKRRFEKKFSINDIELYDDYGHHPSEIKATIMMARDRFPKKRIILIFQPHTFSRTQVLLPDFAKALSLADYSFILPVFASARENKAEFNVSSKDIEKKADKKEVVVVKNNQELFEKLRYLIQSGDVIITMGAGDVYKLKEKIIEVMSNVKVQMSNQIQNLKFKKLGEVLGRKKVFENKELFAYLTLHTNTKAQYYFEAKTKEDFQKAVKIAFELKLPIFILGGGSNIAVTKSEIKGLVIRNIYIKKEKIQETKEFVDYTVSSGYPTQLLVSQTIDEGLEGLEYQKGLPGTIGGAIYMNSKWTKPLKYLSDIVIGALLLDQQGNLKQVDKEYFQFNHGYCILHETKEVLIDITLRFKKENSKVLKRIAEDVIFYRQKTQPSGESSCGCFFRNISNIDKERLNLPTNSVGYLIDSLNLKGLTVGDFTISDIHGNFIINKGKNSKTSDLKKLLNIVKNKVKEKYGIELEEEVILIN